MVGPCGVSHVGVFRGVVLLSQHVFERLWLLLVYSSRTCSCSDFCPTCMCGAPGLNTSRRCFAFHPTKGTLRRDASRSQPVSCSSCSNPWSSDAHPSAAVCAAHRTVRAMSFESAHKVGHHPGLRFTMRAMVCGSQREAAGGRSADAASAICDGRCARSQAEVAIVMCT